MARKTYAATIGIDKNHNDKLVKLCGVNHHSKTAVICDLIDSAAEKTEGQKIK